MRGRVRKRQGEAMSFRPPPLSFFIPLIENACYEGNFFLNIRRPDGPLIESRRHPEDFGRLPMVLDLSG